MLYSQLHHFSADQEQPAVVFLHGLLGSGDDWLETLNLLPDYACLCIDLPGHGQSNGIICQGFEHCCDMIVDAISYHFSPDMPIILVGYSMGARIAMHGLAHDCFSRLNICLSLLEGGNFGLDTVSDKQARWENDVRWAERFCREPIEQVLADWYQQAVFAELTRERRQAVIAKRSKNNAAQVASMLKATSLAKQDYLLDRLKLTSVPIHYIFGDKDVKFRQMAEQSGLAFTQVNAAGHNAHQEQPAAFSEIIRHHIRLTYESVR